MKSSNRHNNRKEIADKVAKKYTKLSYDEAVKYIEDKNIFTQEITGSSGTVYQTETMCYWDDKPYGDIRLSVAVYDNKSSLFGIKKPYTKEVILSSEN